MSELKQRTGQSSNQNPSALWFSADALNPSPRPLHGKAIELVQKAADTLEGSASLSGRKGGPGLLDF